MSKLMAAVALCFAGSVFAAGPYDGIYRIPGSDEYYSVHQNGSRMVVGAFFTVPASGVVYYLNNGQTYTPQRADNWDLFGGPANGAFPTVSGETAFGACFGTLEFNFNIPAVRLLGFTQTASGTAQGVNCASMFSTLVARRGGNVVALERVF